MLNTILKAGQILDLFSFDKSEWGVSEIAATLDISKSSVYDLVASLAHIGLLQRTEQGRYRLGWRMLTYSQILLQSTEFRAEARKGMEDVAAELGETVHLAVLDGNMVVYADKLQGHNAVHVAVTNSGVRLPGHGSAVGKVLLSHRPWHEVVSIMEEQGMTAFTANTITSIEAFRDELEQVRKQGYAYDMEETVVDLCCAAAPIFDFAGQVIAAMSVSVPAYRFERQPTLYRNAIMRVCRRVSRNLGYVPAHSNPNVDTKEVLAHESKRT
ncbi:MAG: IclR family transcriptional regulator [Chloroflexi bacterium]|nr:MAG: IclR family transcriptional regulator [Chloroflexota bacterium]